jgi:ATP-dependent helicase HrpB
MIERILLVLVILLYAPPDCDAFVQYVYCGQSEAIAKINNQHLSLSLSLALSVSASPFEIWSENTSTQNLPILDCLDTIAVSLNKKPNLLLEAPPGAGKTTIVPLAFLSPSHSEKVLLVEPRRVAVRSAALRMASLLHEQVGETVGYAIRGESRRSKQTRITVVTDGVLLKMLQNDPSLEEYNAVILDEFHERGTGSDTALALIREAQLLLREESLKLVVMSATLLGEGEDSQKLVRALGGPQQCDIVTSDGRQYPISIKWANEWKKEHAPLLLPLRQLQKDRKALIVLMCHAIQQTLFLSKDGDMLVFLPGAVEIKRTCHWLKENLSPELEILPLYGSLPREQQDRAIFGSSNKKRRIIVSSPIAEASLTLEGVTSVVDSGLRREPRCDVDTGMPRLVTSTISQASATQRAGRAGRVQEGLCVRLYNQADFDQLQEHSPPEIKNTDLSPTILLLVSWGCSSRKEILNDLPFVDPPEMESLEKAIQLLQDLECLATNDEDEDDIIDKLIIIPHGQQVSKIPAHPRFASALVKATESNDLSQLAGAIAIAFLLDDEIGPNNRQTSNTPDLTLRVQQLYQDIFAGNHHSQKALLKYAARISLQARQAVEDVISLNVPLVDVLSRLGLAILPGFVDLVGERKGDASYGGSTYLLSLGRSARLDDINDPEKKLIVVVDTSTGDDGTARIRHFVSVRKSDLESVAVEKELVFSVPSKGHEVRAKLVRVVGSLELSSTPLPAPSTDRVGKVLGKVIYEFGGAYAALISTLTPDKRRSLDSFLGRLQLASSSSCNENADPCSWPSWIGNLEEELDALVNPWLSSGIKSLKEIDVMSILLTELTPEQQYSLGQQFPQTINAPDGTNIPIRYAPNQPPTARAKLQQFFGCTTSPQVGNGIPVSLELMSPSNKLLGQTRDLPFFWSEIYPAVRSEMRGRYPKYPWPEDPLTAQATNQTKKQLGVEGDAGSTTKSRGKKKKRGKKG